MNNGSFRTYGYSDNRSPDYYEFSWTLESQDKTANTSTISWKVVAGGGATGSSFIYVKEKYVSVNGEREENNDNVKTVNGTTPFSGTTTIQHNNDGTGSFSASCGGAFYYHGSYNSTGSGSWDLPKIPRAAQFDLSGFEGYDRPVEDSVNVGVIIGNSNYYSEITISPLKNQIFEIAKRTAKNGNNKITFTREELDIAYRLIPQNSAILVIKMKTYTDSGKGTLVGEARGGLSYRATIVNANPVFSNFEYKDVDSSTTALTGNNQKIILGKSDLQVNISYDNRAIEQKGASIESYNIGNYVLPFSNSTVSKTISNYPSESITVSAIDSRGNSTSITKNLTVIRYFDIVVKGQNIVREDGVGEKTTISFNGQFFNSNFGSQANTVTATYKYRIGNGNFTNGTTPLQISKSGNNFSCNQAIIGDTGNGFSISNSYEIIVTVSDKLSSREIRYTLIAGAPAIAVYGNKLAFNGNYDESKPYIPVQYHGRSLKGVYVGENQPVEEQDVWFKEGRNLLDISKVKAGWVSDRTGIISESTPEETNRRYTPYIEIKPDEDYFLTNIGVNRWGSWYDENKAFVNGIAGYGKLHSPSNAKYVVITLLNEYLNQYMFNIGNEIPFEAYGSKEILTFNGTGYDKFDIIESGENGRGYYIKYYDGTLIQYAQRGHSFGSLAKYPNIEWWHEEEFFDTFPIPFKDLNYDAYVNFAEKPNNPIFISFVRNDSTERLEFGVVTPIKFSQSITFNWFAIGRWK